MRQAKDPHESYSQAVGGCQCALNAVRSRVTSRDAISRFIEQQWVGEGSAEGHLGQGIKGYRLAVPWMLTIASSRCQDGLTSRDRPCRLGCEIAFAFWLGSLKIRRWFVEQKVWQLIAIPKAATWA